jgi:type II secretory pathway component PulK
VWAATEDKTDVKYGGGTYSVMIIDEERKLNLNALPPNAAGVLQYLFENVGKMKKEAAEITANAVLDYRDPDLLPLGGQGNNEIDYYTEMARKIMGRNLPPDWVFRPKNDYFINLSELLEIPGITPETLNGKADQAPSDPFERAAQKRRKIPVALT